jgi:hypothetical protein
VHVRRVRVIVREDEDAVALKVFERNVVIGK